jgi:hypothetical protein
MIYGKSFFKIMTTPIHSPTDRNPISFDRTSNQSEQPNTQEPVQGHLAGVPIQPVNTNQSLASYLPRPIPLRERTSNLDYFIGLIANPLRTLDAAMGSLSGATIHSTSVLLPDDIAEQRNRLSDLNDALMQVASTLDSPHINRTLPEYETYRTAFIKAAQSCSHAWNILNSDLNSNSNTLAAFETALHQASNDFDTLTTASRAFSDAQRRQSSETPKGAYLVSAVAAASAGIYPPTDARGPIAMPHAISIAYGTPADSKISEQQAKSDKNPEGLSVVEAEAARPDDQSPLIEATNLLTNEEIVELIEQREQAYNTANEKAP